MSEIELQSLACGMPLVTERIPGVRSVGLTWLLPVGSARDPDDRVGLSAMIEELLLRGAGELDSRQHADLLDGLGVSRGTGTETHFTSISATLLGSRLAEALPPIVDMVRRPRFDAGAIEPTRSLCLQSIAGLADDPQEHVMHLLRERHAPAPLNRSHLGTAEGIAAVRPEDPGAHWHRCAVPEGSILAVAGDVDPPALARRLDELLAGWSGAAQAVAPGAAAVRGARHVEQTSSQVHIALAHDAPRESDPGCWLERVGTAVLSGGMSCRLFTEVREKRSLCYAVYASYATSRDDGRVVAYSGTTPERAQETLDVLHGELQRVRSLEGAVTAEELARAAIGLKSRLVLRGESTAARAGALARDVFKLGRPRSLAELAGAVDEVTLDALNEHLQSRPIEQATIVTIGPEALVVPEATTV